MKRHRITFVAAGAYNIAWGCYAVLDPQWFYRVTGLPLSNSPQIFACLGMVLGLYGLLYLEVARRPETGWPIAAVGLAGKILGPLGLAWLIATGTWPASTVVMIVTNDLIWWVPFALILWDAFVYRRLGDPSGLVVHTFVKESRIPASPEAVFRFHETPDALVKLIPPGEPLKVLVPPASLEPGTRVVLGGSLLGLPLTWVAVHTEYDPPRLFADRQESGPFEHWLHLHRIQDDGAGGTILRDEIEYALPFGWIGRVFGGRLVRRKLDAMFEHRHAATRRAVCGAEATARA
jgi:ligand-binding SRPBCC domain-containing protein